MRGPGFLSDRNPQRPALRISESVKKASQSLPPAGAKANVIRFCGGVYVAKNTSQSASVEFVRFQRTNYARGRLQAFCQKRATPFFGNNEIRNAQRCGFHYCRAIAVRKRTAGCTPGRCIDPGRTSAGHRTGCPPSGAGYPERCPAGRRPPAPCACRHGSWRGSQR